MTDTSLPQPMRLRDRPAVGEVRLTPAGERLLKAASELFYEHGIRAVGVDMIAETAGTTKKTLYDRFGSKDALIALYLQRRADRWRQFVEDRLSEHPAVGGTESDARAGTDGSRADGVDAVDVSAAVARVHAALTALEDWYAELSRGCAFVNAFAEIGGTDHPGIEVVREEKEWVRKLYTRLLRESGAGAAADELGPQLALLHEGATIMATSGDEPHAFEQARTAARRLLESALP